MQRLRLWAGLALIFLAPFVICAGPPAPHPIPLIHAHAHNDYEHSRPLLDALDCGFCSVEADVFLVGDQLLVAHSLTGIRPGRTLQALYLDPLRERIKANGGRVYPNGPTLTLLIDIKSEAEPTYAAVKSTLKDYADVMTVFHEGKR